jgi:hypothetical protein
MNCDDATKFNRKSGLAKWRDLEFSGLILEMFFSTGPRGVEGCAVSFSSIICSLLFRFHQSAKEENCGSFGKFYMP